MRDNYQILEVLETATPETIKEQYRFLVHAWHPDKFPNPAQKAKAQEKIRELNKAYAVLGDASKRQQYDREQAAARRKKEEDAQQKIWVEFERQRRQQTAAAEKAAAEKAAAERPAAPEPRTPPPATAPPPTPTPKRQKRSSQAHWSRGGQPLWGLVMFCLGLLSGGGMMWQFYQSPPASSTLAAPSFTLTPVPPTVATSTEVTPMVLTPIVQTKVPLTPMGSPTAGDVKASAVYVGTNTTCALLTNGEVRCWGLKIFEANVPGKSITGYDLPKALTWGEAVRAVSLAPQHVCVLSTAGRVKCGGYDFGLGNLTDPTFGLKAVSGLLNDNVALAAAPDPAGPTCALAADGRVKCVSAVLASPQYITGMVNISALVVGAQHVCGLNTSGGVVCWGLNAHGELGRGNTTPPQGDSGAANVVGLESGVTALAAGRDHTCALRANGEVRCWGGNGYGQLGDGTLITQTLSVAVFGLQNAVAIAAGAKHTCALLGSGAVKCWGENLAGQLGDGTLINHNTLVDVVGLEEKVVALAAGGGGHTCVLTVGGRVLCWGESTFGEVGEGGQGEEAVTRPTEVVGLMP